MKGKDRTLLVDTIKGTAGRGLRREARVYEHRKDGKLTYSIEVFDEVNLSGTSGWPQDIAALNNAYVLCNLAAPFNSDGKPADKDFYQLFSAAWNDVGHDVLATFTEEDSEEYRADVIAETILDADRIETHFKRSHADSDEVQAAIKRLRSHSYTVQRLMVKAFNFGG